MYYAIAERRIKKHRCSRHWDDWRKTRMNTSIALAIVAGAWYNVDAVRHGAACAGP
jgi:hypothetical protein